MKKAYNAPKLLLERFELKHRITESCSAYQDDTVTIIGYPSQTDKATCGWKVGEGMILWPSAPTCTIPTSISAESGGQCYNNFGPNFYIPSFEGTFTS